MGFYDLSKEERLMLVAKIKSEIITGLKCQKDQLILNYFSDEDTYIRKAAYQAMGKYYLEEVSFRKPILETLQKLFTSDHPKLRQTVVNAAGEIGKTNFQAVTLFFDRGLFDEHHSVRNAVIGSMKKIGEKNPKPLLEWAKPYLKHEDKEIRREVCHGLELRGRTHPQEILPHLAQLQDDTTARVRNTLIHVLGQISYKKGCLETVVASLDTWHNKPLVQDAFDEIVDVHKRYQKFAVYSQKEAIDYIDKNSSCNNSM